MTSNYLKLLCSCYFTVNIFYFILNKFWIPSTLLTIIIWNSQRKMFNKDCISLVLDNLFVCWWGISWVTIYCINLCFDFICGFYRTFRIFYILIIECCSFTCKRWTQEIVLKHHYLCWNIATKLESTLGFDFICGFYRTFRIFYILISNIIIYAEILLQN